MKARAVVFLLIISVITGVSVGGILRLQKEFLPSQNSNNISPRQAQKYTLMMTRSSENSKLKKGVFVPLNRMPKHLIDAVIAVEDSRFWNHKGIDYIAIGRAVLKDILHAGLKEGGSTITQQLAKIVFLTPEKTFKRKIREVSLAMKMEKNLDKKEILELYLNKIYFGHGAYGVEMASRVYFGKSVGELTLPEAAMITALIKAPSTYSPYNNLTKSKERQETVLLRMEEEGYIKKSEREKAAKQPLYLSTLRRGMEANNYFIEYVRKYLEEKYGEETVYKGGLKVYTTLDRGMQAAAQKALQEGLRELDKRRGWRGPVEHKDIKDIDVKKEMGSKDVQSAAIGGGDDITSGLVLKVSETEAVIKARGIIGKLSIADAQWAGALLDSKTKKTTTIKGFNLTKILKPGILLR